ncbi:MAG: NAD(P)H-dependent oxidoreductase [Peptostreptococcaceae bacterium]|nr:NAD(P)H-dependent oxidoreductase [Peptostreptococcaceae bacterium]
MRLYINACVHVGEGSRTKELAEYYLMHTSGDYETIDISDGKLSGLDVDELDKRNILEETGDFSDHIFDYAKKMAKADEIIIAAPYWDLSYPAVLKAFLERTFVRGITFIYEGNKQVGLCKAEELVFITTSGGFIGENNYSGDYIKGVSEFFGIKEFEQYQAEGLDIIGRDVKEILEKTKSAII